MAASKSSKSLGARLAADPKLKAKYLSNPGLRSKLPDSMLSPAQRATRQANAYAKAPITDGSTVTNAQLGREAANYTTAQYAPQRQQLATQQSQATQHTADVAGWYDQYQRELAQHFANVQATGQQAIAQDQQLAQGVRALDTTQAQGMQQAATQDAASRGGTVDPSLATTASNASLVRQQMLAATTGAQASSNAANSVYADTLAHVVAPGQGVKAKQNAADRSTAVQDAMKALSTQEGASKADYMTKRTSDERNYVLANRTLSGNQANQAADNALNVAKTKTDAQFKSAQVDIKRGVDPVTGKPIVKPDSPTAAKTRADLAYFKKHGYYPPTGPPKTGKGAAGAKARPLTPQQHAVQKDQIDTAQTWIKKLQAAKGHDGKPVTSAQVRTLLEQGARSKDKNGNPIVVPKLPKDVINAAYDLIVNGKLSPANVAALHRRGLSIKQLGYPTVTSSGAGGGAKRVKKVPAGTGLGGAAGTRAP